VLDIAFKEDKSRVRKDHASENLAVLRHMALNLLKKEKRLKAAFTLSVCKLLGTQTICLPFSIVDSD
jgi:hypothetical protein